MDDAGWASLVREEPAGREYFLTAPVRAKMARVLFTLSLLLFVFTTARVFGAPTEDSESPKLNRQKRTFGFSLLADRDWEEFRRWPFISMTPMKNMMNMFREEESKESIIKRIEELEHGHKLIIEYLSKMRATANANQCDPSSNEKPAEKLPKPVSHLMSESTAAPKIDVTVQTDAPMQPSTQPPTPTTFGTPEVKDKMESPTTMKVATLAVKEKVEPSITKITTAEVDDKVVSPAPTKLTSAEVKDKMQPSMATKISTTEVEDKVVPTTSTKIAASEVVGKLVPPTPTKFTSAELKDKVEPSTTEKVTTPEDRVKVVPSEHIKLTSAEDLDKIEDKKEPSPSKNTLAEVKDKMKPSIKPQEATSSEESKESNEKVDTSHVDDDVPATSSTAKAVTDSDQETSTEAKESNDVNK